MLSPYSLGHNGISSQAKGAIIEGVLRTAVLTNLALDGNAMPSEDEWLIEGKQRNNVT
jgi:hypothetical protein